MSSAAKAYHLATKAFSEFVFSTAVSRDAAAAGRPRPYGQRLIAIELRKCSGRFAGPTIGTPALRLSMPYTDGQNRVQ